MHSSSIELDLVIGSTASHEWVRVLRNTKSTKNTIYTTQRGPAARNGVPGRYQHFKMEKQSFDSLELVSDRIIGTIESDNAEVVDKAASEIEAKVSQLYIVAVIARLEKKGLDLKGMAKLYAEHVDPAVQLIDIESRLAQMYVADISNLSLCLS
ncbi:uncharacterized protein BDV17DRAFT_270196 [Aspergillus undulatus]|uniref:uncharacterized protein n=1 Tax=Aspergillus undulatus TaxID=1810928 RepID=UPI003CCE2FCE